MVYLSELLRYLQQILLSQEHARQILCSGLVFILPINDYYAFGSEIFLCSFYGLATFHNNERHEPLKDIFNAINHNNKKYVCGILRPREKEARAYFHEL